MEIIDRISAFSHLGEVISSLSEEEKDKIAREVINKNPWFIKDSVTTALNGISYFLKVEKLKSWISGYHFKNNKVKNVGLAMAGNIPLVGFHDFLCVLISGHRCMIKLSSQDPYLLPLITSWLIEIEPRFKDLISFEERLKNMDAVIATGSDNTARYFEYYFRNIPHIIRKNRSSCAIILGEESIAQLKDLGNDVFSYYGLGCRNVSKLFVPDGFDFSLLDKGWESFSGIINQHKYAHNYDYQKSIFLVNGTPFIDLGYLLLTENSNLVSPISVLYYEYYKDQSHIHSLIDTSKDKLQCIVSVNSWFENSVAFGQAQMPELWDYADGVDTLKFLTKI
jgi:hypothetical protein